MFIPPAPFAAPPPLPPFTLIAKPDETGTALRAAMIWADGLVPQEKPYFLAFRRHVPLPLAPRRAIFHLFADSRYLLWVNGQALARGPVRFQPNGPEYDSVDVTAHLHAGDNVVSVLVMAGASNGRMMHHAPGLAAQLQIEAPNGERLTLKTDASWKWSEKIRYLSPKITWANVYDRIDARVEDGDWTLPAYDDAAWKSAAPTPGEAWGPLSARSIPALRETILAPKFEGNPSFPVTLRAGQELRFEMGRMVQAFTRLDLEADAGSEIELEYAKIHYIARAGRQNYLSSDTRALTGGVLRVTSGRVTIHRLQLVELLYPFDCAGSFQSSDATLNQLWRVCTRSLQLMSEDAYVDCADRERVEWMDCDPPAFDVTRVAMSGPNPDGSPRYADARLMRAMLRRTALTLQPEGWVKAHTASDRYDIHALMEDRSCDWIQGTRRYLESTGDLSIVRETWPAIATQLRYFLKKRTPRGLVRAREWVVWGNPMSYQTCEGTALNAFVFKALMDGAHLGLQIGENQDAREFETAARELSQAINTVLWDEKNGTYFSAYFEKEAYEATQLLPKARKLELAIENNLVEPNLHAALFALDQQIVPPERRERVTRYLMEHRGDPTRIMALYYLFHQLYAANTPQLDQEILDRIRVEWKEMAQWPWQTTWEDTSGGSKAHIYGMFPAYFLSSYVLGVRPDGPASNQRLLIDPRLGDLSYARGVVVTEIGLVPISWQKNAGKLQFEFELPKGSQALLKLPPGRLELDGKLQAFVPGQAVQMRVGSGKHRGSLALSATPGRKWK